MHRPALVAGDVSVGVRGDQRQSDPIDEGRDGDLLLLISQAAGDEAAGDGGGRRRHGVTPTCGEVA
ncbi:hypothetical protein EF294_18320 [Gordonia oryzae]|uniref:Uncharacterized protein n=1 Tax=Gordonia oryzae TaxID=2487349 RepID=A0A3N4G516_9ACTN|nr:hypothetical protein EF294_18320 [Gordonia oryzae]